MDLLFLYEQINNHIRLYYKDLGRQQAMHSPVYNPEDKKILVYQMILFLEFQEFLAKAQENGGHEIRYWAQNEADNIRRMLAITAGGWGTMAADIAFALVAAWYNVMEGDRIGATSAVGDYPQVLTHQLADMLRKESTK